MSRGRCRGVELAASDATFKLVVTGSQWTAAGSDDAWAAYLDERDALFQGIADAGIGGVVLMSGDIHRSELRRLDAPGYPLPELTSSPLANVNSACPALGGELLACYDAGPSFVTIDVDGRAADPTLTAAIHDEQGTVVATWVIARSELGPG